jgi:hypothetical protein
MARFGQASIGSPESSVRSASSHTTPAQAAPRVPFLQRRITNLLSDQTPGPGLAPHPHPPPHRHRHRPLTYHARLPLSGLPSGQTQFRGLPLLLLTSARFESFTTAARHGRFNPAPTVRQGAGSTSTRRATSAGGTAASESNAMSASVSRR